MFDFNQLLKDTAKAIHSNQKEADKAVLNVVSQILAVNGQITVTVPSVSVPQQSTVKRETVDATPKQQKPALPVAPKPTAFVAVDRPVPTVSPKPVSSSEMVPANQQFQLHVLAPKPCNNGCLLSGTCTMKKKHNLLSQCGEHVWSLKELAMEGGEILIKTSTSDKDDDVVYKNGVEVGIVAKNGDTKDIRFKVLNVRPGKTLKFHVSLHPKAVRDSIYTRLWAEFLGEVEETPAPSQQSKKVPTAPKAQPKPQPQPPQEEVGIDLSDFVLPIY